MATMRGRECGSWNEMSRVGLDDMVVAPSYLGMSAKYASSLTIGKMGVTLNTKGKGDANREEGSFRLMVQLWGQRYVNYTGAYFRWAWRVSKTWWALAWCPFGLFYLLRHQYLKLDLGLGDVLGAAAAAGNLLCLGDLAPHSLNIMSAYLCGCVPRRKTETYLGTEVFKRVTLNGVDAELRTGLDSCEATGNCSLMSASILVLPYSLLYPGHGPISSSIKSSCWVTYGRTACCQRTPQRSQQGRVSAARWKERGWRGHPCHRTRREC